jgi:hypothetical protein
MIAGRTNFVNDEETDDLKLLDDSTESSLLTKEKGVIALFNILDTIRLHRIINSFNCIRHARPVRVRKFSSKVLLLRDLSLQKKSIISQIV